MLPLEKEKGRMQLVLLAARQDPCEVRPNLGCSFLHDQVQDIAGGRAGGGAHVEAKTAEEKKKRECKEK